MKDLHFDGEDPEWAKREVVDGKPKNHETETLLKEIERLKQANRDISAEFEKTR